MKSYVFLYTLFFLFMIEATIGQNINSNKSAQPNIIFIEADDLMPRFMNKLGDGFGYTPNLDLLGSRGVHFPSAVAQGPMCGPSRNSMITNLYPHNLGFYRNGQLKNLPKDIQTFPTTLQKAGYKTAYIGKSHIKPQHKNDSKEEALKSYGFDYVNNTGERYALWKSLKDGKSIEHLSFIKHLKKRGKYKQFLDDNKKYGGKSTMQDDIDYLDGFTTNVAVDWISKERTKDQPFFMWFNFCLPHGPYDVPQRYFDIAESINIPNPKTTTFGHPIPAPLTKDNKAVEPEKASKDRIGEMANVAFMDKMIGNLITALETSGELDNTVIVFFSDHSIFLGNHGRIHKGSLYEENLNTSLIVSYPKHFPQDTVLNQPVELLDLIPTVFELAGVENPNETALNGISLVPLLNGAKTKGRKYAFSEIWGAQSATDGRYRYIVSEGVEILYDHLKDPYEMANIASKKSRITKRFRKAVENWMKNTGPVNPPNTF